MRIEKTRIKEKTIESVKKEIQGINKSFSAGWLQKRLQIDWDTLTKILEHLEKKMFIVRFETAAGDKLYLKK